MAKIVFLLLVAPIYIVSLLPLKLHYLFAGIIRFFLEKVLRYRKAVVYINLSRSFPDFKYNRIGEVARKFYQNFADIIVESVWMVSASKKSVAKRGTVENPELVRELYEQGRSVIVLAGHLGNWEFLTALPLFCPADSLGFSENQFKFIYKRQNIGFFDNMMKWLRSRHIALELIESNSAVRHIVKSKDIQGCYFMLADQSPLPGSKFAVDFLNQQTFIMNGPEMISKKTNIPVVFLDMNRSRRGRYSLRFSLVAEDPSQMADGEITSKYASLLEASIRSSPENWLWSHRRWKRGVEENSRRKIV